MIVHVGVQMFMTCRYADNKHACITCGQGYVALYANPNYILMNTVCWSHILCDFLLTVQDARTDLYDCCK